MSVNVALWHLAPTWSNAELLLHRLWGQARDGEYRKDEWGAFQSLMTRLRYQSPVLAAGESVTVSLTTSPVVVAHAAPATTSDSQHDDVR